MSTKTTFSPPPVAAFECVVCGFESWAAGTCPRCDAPLLDQRHAEPWQLEARKQRVARVRAWPVFVAFAAVLWLLGLLMRRADALQGATYALFGLAMLAVAVWDKVQTDRVDDDSSVKQRAQLAHSSLAETVTTSKVIEGERVRVCGASVMRRAALGFGDSPVIAIEQTVCASVIDPDSRYSNAKTLVTCVQTGGEFTLQSPDGTTIRVRLDHFVILNGEPVKDATIIPEGAIVNVSGLARWTTDEERSGMRSIGRALELTGTEKEPIVIEAVPLEKWIDQQKSTENAIATGVRVAANNPTDRSAESESLMDEVRFEQAPTGVQKTQ